MLSVALCAAAECKPPAGETSPQCDLPPSASSGPEATSPPPCSPTHIHTHSVTLMRFVIRLSFLDVKTNSRLTRQRTEISQNNPQRKLYIIEAELVDRNCEDVAEAAQGLSPQQLHKYTNFLR